MGLALAQPKQKIVLFDSDGDIQMSMGILATIGEQQPKNFYHFMLDNECYATTGGQPVPHAKTLAYHDVARACGYPRAYAYDNLETFSINVERILVRAGAGVRRAEGQSRHREQADRLAREVAQALAGAGRAWISRRSSASPSEAAAGPPAAPSGAGVRSDALRRSSRSVTTVTGLPPGTSVP